MTSPNRDIDFEPLTSVLQKLLRLNATKSGIHRWEIFKHAVSKVLPITELCIIPQSKRRELNEYDQIAVDGSTVRLIDLWFAGEEGRLEAARRMDREGILVRIVDGRAYMLSSGQISFIRLAAQLCLNVNYGTLVLIDEPETHLHPNLISDLVVMLNDILAICNSVAIIATHSAYMVREVPSSQVHHINVDNENLIDIGSPRLKTFGADVGAISNFIFEDGFINRFSLEAVERIENLSLNKDSWEEELKDELSTEALMFFRRKLKSKLQEDE